MYKRSRIACVFQDFNEKWMGASLPFPSKEVYCTDENGEGIGHTRQEAVLATVSAGCKVISESEVTKSYL